MQKTKTIRKELGSLSQVIDERLDAVMKTGIRRADIDLIENEIESADLDQDAREAVDEELEATRERQLDLRKQIDRLRGMLADSQKAIGLSVDHFRSAISCALQILGAEPLKTSVDCGLNGSDCPVFPALDQRPARTRPGLKPWTASARPARATRSSGSGAAVPRSAPSSSRIPASLPRKWFSFTSSTASSSGCSRVSPPRASSITISRAPAWRRRPTPFPRVLLIGRLALYGPGAARLHEELIPVTARWIDPAIRKSALTPYGREAESRTLSLLDAALLEKHARPVPDVVIGQLQATAPRDVRELLHHLEARAAEYAKDANRSLAKTGRSRGQGNAGDPGNAEEAH